MARRKKTQQRAEAIRAESAPDALDPLRDFQGNKFEYYVARFFLVLREHSKEALIITAATLLIIVTGIVYLVYSRNQARDSLQAYEQLLEQEAGMPKSQFLKKLDEYAQNYTGSKAQLRVKLRKIGILEALDRKKDAAQIAAELAAGASGAPERAYFYLKAAVLYEEAGAHSSAHQSYGKAGENLEEDKYLTAFAQFGQARALIRMGKTTEGREALRKITESDGPEAEELRILATAFMLKHAEKK